MVFTVMLPVLDSDKLFRLVSAPSVKVELPPPVEDCVPPMRVVPSKFRLPAGLNAALPTTVNVSVAGKVMSPATVVATKLPPTVDVLSVRAPPFVRVTEPRVGAAVVLKFALPATVSAPD